jgi:hypothetical protein
MPAEWLMLHGLASHDGCQSLLARNMPYVLPRTIIHQTTLLLLLLLQVTSIHIPSVRELPSEEWAARQAAATSWRAAVKAQGQRQGLAKPPPEVRQFAR